MNNYMEKCKKSEYKSNNLQYITLVCWADGKNNSLTKRLMFQTSFFFIFYYGLKALKTLYFYLCKSKKKEIKRFLQRILQEIMEKATYYIEDCRILEGLL